MRKVFYGWVIVGAGMLVIAVVSGMVNNCFSLFVVPICDEMGYSRAQVGACQTIISVGCALMALFAGYLYRMFKLIRLMQLSAIALIIAYFLLSASRALMAFYACACVIALALGMLTWMPFSVIINNWFHARRSLAIGLTYMGSGLGGMAASFAGGYLISALGWRSTIMCFTCVLVIVLIPIVFFVLRVHPRDKNLSPYGEAPGEAYVADVDEEGARFKDEARTGKFRLLALSIAIIGLSCNGFNATLAAHLADSGYAQRASATVFSAYMLLLAGGKLTLGYMYDRLGVRRASMITISLALMSMLALAYCRFPIALAALLAFCGVGIAVSSVGVPVVARHVYGQREYATFAGVFSAASHSGGAIAPALLGLVCDVSGSYAPGYMACAALLFMCLVIMRAYLPARG